MTRTLPRRLWREMEWPTAEAFATWSRGVFLEDLVPVLERLFDAVERGERCWQADHEGLVEHNCQLEERLDAAEAALGRIDDEATEASVRKAIREQALDRFTGEHLAPDARDWLAGFSAWAAIGAIRAALSSTQREVGDE